MARFLDLPTEVLGIVLHFIANDRSLCRLAQVNHRLNECASDEALWYDVCHTTRLYAALDVAAVDAQLALPGGDPAFRGWKRLCRKHREVRKRKALVAMIQQFHVAALSDNNVWRVVEQLRSLTDLDLSQTCVGVHGARYLGRAFEHLAATSNPLEAINLRNNEVRREGAEALCRPLALTPGLLLCSLNLQGNRIGPDGAACLAELLRANQSLRTAELGSNFFGPAGARALAEGLAANTTLRFLGLGDNAIGTQGLLALLPNLHVKQLVLRMNSIGKDGATALWQRLARETHSVTYIDLTDNPIGSKVALQLTAIEGVVVHVQPVQTACETKCVIS